MRRAASLLATCLAVAGVAEAAESDRRTLATRETRAIVAEIMDHAEEALSEDPSCKSDLKAPGPMSVAAGLADHLTRAVLEKSALFIQASCFKRGDYPLAQHQEYCRLSFGKGKKPAAEDYGFIFIMDWTVSRIVKGSIECFR